jgi:Major Facilitator Superfamily
LLRLLRFLPRRKLSGASSPRRKRSTEAAESIAVIAEAPSRSGEIAVDVGGFAGLPADATFVIACRRGARITPRRAAGRLAGTAAVGAGDGFGGSGGSLPARHGTFRRNQAIEAKEFAMNAASSTEVHRWRAFAVLAVCYFMTIVELTIVNVALPTIGRKLHFSESNLQWVMTAYALTFGGFLLLGGRAADLLGRRRIMMIGLGLFTAVSLGAGLANSDGFLIAMRGLQGLGAAVVLPAALSIVMNMFSEGAERNKALGVWGGIGALGATVGLLTVSLSPATSAGTTSSFSTCRSG